MIETPQSSNVAKFKYDEQSKLLTVVFKNQTAYNYFNVPLNIFEKLKLSSSKGRFLANNIKGCFLYSKVNIS